MALLNESISRKGILVPNGARQRKLVHSQARFSTNVHEDPRRPCADSIMAERATTQVFGLTLMVVFVGILVLNAISC
jgi:hypothetical protein